ncbi:AMP-binding protein [Gordonia sp. HNM0687]|uniref:AMP-binding protein n=1 Tax=Gordonia mangrovi TaxID=2665643 RepID=A0A6L7GU88_9ACTN|nr:AMP-binding protein [Gordonia mangrovi]MXP23506.1 AMP-binding protein [Gordonia mangrovi]UVF76600.1 AMP-binding protein [Gordonia mangrovi]
MTTDPLNNLAHRIPVDVLRLQAEERSEQVFLRDADTSLTYGEVDALADRFAKGFSDLGVGVGSRVALFMDNSADLAVTAFGVNRAGGVWSPFSTEYRGDWLAELFRASKAEVLVVEAHHLAEVAKLNDLPFKHVIVRGSGGSELEGVVSHDFADLAKNERWEGSITHDPLDTSAVLWTSGTTGRSKGVMQPHAVWMLWAQRHNDVFRKVQGPGEVFYYPMPMYNSGGWVMNIFPALVSGGTACIDSRFSVSDYWDRIRHFGAEHTMTLGTMHIYLMNQPPKPDDADNPLRSLVMAPIVPQIMKPFMERFGVERIAAGFGTSEVMGATLYTSDMPLKSGSSGYTVDDDLVETRLLDHNDAEVGVGEVGEFCVRPRVPGSLFSGYLDEPEKTIEAFRNLWFHTGDLGRRDEDGELFFVDRKKDALRHKGRNTSTFEVEHIALRHPDVANAAAVGVKLADLEHEEELMLVLQPNEGAVIDPLEFCKFIDENAPYFFVPRYVKIVQDFPMTPTGKIQKYVLRDFGVTSDTWDRTKEAPDWAERRPAKAAAMS